MGEQSLLSLLEEEKEIVTNLNEQIKHVSEYREPYKKQAKNQVESLEIDLLDIRLQIKEYFDNLQSIVDELKK